MCDSVNTYRIVHLHDPAGSNSTEVTGNDSYETAYSLSSTKERFLVCVNEDSNDQDIDARKKLFELFRCVCLEVSRAKLDSCFSQCLSARFFEG